MVKGATMTTSLQLILGGARSGKSRYALSQGDEPASERRIFLATAFAGDEEMKKRIEHHQAERGNRWTTLEEPYHLAAALEKSNGGVDSLLVVDCATLWISNLLCGMGGKSLSSSEVEKEFEKLIEILPRQKGRIRIVSNEVGLGIVPDNLLGRQFRDLQGQFNQSLAALAGQVILMTAGLPQKIK
jgi:adenosylcobinamide kinase/adenosylcobinamide-phosphate guanylyltransferase